MTTQKNRFDRGLDTVFQQIMASILSPLISVALLGICTYLLFTYQDELNKLNKDNMLVMQKIERLTTENKMIADATGGWFFIVSNKELLDNVFTQLDSSKAKNELDPSFVKTTTLWCDYSNEQLNRERGQIAGYFISDPLIEKFQKTVLSVYDGQIAIMIEIKTIIANWNKQSISENTQSTAFLVIHYNQEKSLISEINTTANQIKSESPLNKDQDLLTIGELEDKSNQIATKRTLSTMGAVFGGCAFMFFGWHKTKPYFNRSKKKVSRSRKPR